MSRFGRLVSLARGTGQTMVDTLRWRSDPDFVELVRTAARVAPGAAKLALPWLVKARRGHEATLLSVVETNARHIPDELALQMDDQHVSWGELEAQTSEVARVLSDLGVRRGQVVALMARNTPLYLAVVLGVTRLGGITALINWHLEGAALEHAVRAAGAEVALVEADFAARFAERDLPLRHLVTFGDARAPEGLEARMAAAHGGTFPRASVDASEDFVFIYTSGTTGLPKPCRVTHARALLAGAGFSALMFRFEPGDKLYSVLPLYHSSALLIGAGSAIVARRPLALREAFSARAFWPDVQRYQATATLYIGELARYLLHTPPCPEERHNPLRVAVGNGMRADVWLPFAERFGIAEIREFYGATEAPLTIFNITGKPGSVGHVPLRRIGPIRLARYDVVEDQLIRDAAGFAIECAPGEVGQLVMRIKDDPGAGLGGFRGYTDEKATQKKIVESLFEPGDRYFLSGDLLRRDEADFFYFVDRIGDTYRWKGENVSTAEVEEVVGRAPGVRGAAVVGVTVPGHEGRAGLCALVCEGDFDPQGFFAHVQELPRYAQPVFVRVMGELSTTGTFKIQKSALREQGADPTEVNDPLYLSRDEAYVPLDAEAYQRLVTGEHRL